MFLVLHPSHRWVLVSLVPRESREEQANPPSLLWLYMAPLYSVETEAGLRSWTCSQLPSSRQHSLFSVSPVAQINYIFLSSHGEGSCLRAQCVSMESLVFCWLQLGFEPAPNFLQPGSGLRKHSRGSLWHWEAELCPTASALAFIAQYFLIFLVSFLQPSCVHSHLSHARKA